MTPSLFATDRPPTQDGSGRTERLRQLIQRHEAHPPNDWQTEVDRLRALPPIEQLRAVHAYVNHRLTYVDHANIWKTPREAFAVGGVCVEYATTKMLLLRDAGFPESSLRVVTLRPLTPNGIYHVVLLARLPDEAVFVLDSPKRAQSATIVPLEAFRERIRPVVWAGWQGGFSSNDHPGAATGGYTTSRPTTQRDRTAYFASGDRLVDIAADLRVLRYGETPLSPSERRRLALLRRYYHDPTTANRQPLTTAEVEKLNGIRTRLARVAGIRPTEKEKKYFFEP
ncbi:MAG: transglutaminase-like cysteine peptidase [Magnetococcales bacterium]|nr:transglutaminase-like cysteine peptidase [Magnetococcales bacterium]